MYELLTQTISEEVDKIVKQNMDSLISTLNTNLDQSEPISKNTVLMCLNTIHYSSVLSVSLVLKSLCEAGVVRIDEDALRKASLKLVK